MKPSVRRVGAPLYARLSIARAWQRRAAHATAGALRSRGRAWAEPAAARTVRRPLRPGQAGERGRGGQRGDVEELEGGVGPLAVADGGHSGRRTCEAAVGPAGRCHVTVSSGPARSGDLGPLVVSAGSVPQFVLVSFPRGGASLHPTRLWLQPAAALLGSGRCSSRRACAAWWFRKTRPPGLVPWELRAEVALLHTRTARTLLGCPEALFSSHSWPAECGPFHMSLGPLENRRRGRSFLGCILQVTNLSPGPRLGLKPKVF